MGMKIYVSTDDKHIKQIVLDDDEEYLSVIKPTQLNASNIQAYSAPHVRRARRCRARGAALMG